MKRIKAVAPALALLSGCFFNPKGECTTAQECPFGTTCAAGLCIPPPGDAAMPGDAAESRDERNDAGPQSGDDVGNADAGTSGDAAMPGDAAESRDGGNDAGSQSSGDGGQVDAGTSGLDWGNLTGPMYLIPDLWFSDTFQPGLMDPNALGTFAAALRKDLGRCQVSRTTGKLYYIRRFEVNGELRQFNANLTGFADIQAPAGLSRSVPNPGTNDIILPTPGCDSRGPEDFLIAPLSGHIWYRCASDFDLHGPSGAVAPKCLKNGQISAISEEGAFLCTYSVVTKDGLEWPHDPIGPGGWWAWESARPRIGGGFWGVLRNSNPGFTRWFISTTGEVTKDGDYASNPGDIPYSNDQVIMDGDGALYQSVSDRANNTVILRFDADLQHTTIIARQDLDKAHFLTVGLMGFAPSF